MSSKIKSKFLEIEVKYELPRFVELKNYPAYRGTHKLEKFISVKGFDIYWSNKTDFVRLRTDGRDFREFTTKKRVNKGSNVVRIETDLKLNKHTNEEDVNMFLTSLGFKKRFTLHKEADIYFFSCELGKVVISVYAAKKGSKTKYFLEIEGDKTQSKAVNLKLLNYWSEIIENNLCLTKKNVINKSLFEIFSERK